MTRNSYIKIALLVIISIILVAYLFEHRIKKPNEPVNFCNQTMAEANNPINWHNGIYSPEGCNIIKK